MGQPKMSKAAYEKLKKAFEKSVKKESQMKAAKTLKKSFDAEMANRDNERRRQEAKGIKPSGFPMYSVGGKMEMKEYEFGGKVYNDGGRALFDALKKKFGEG